jgi:putative oxidoreductase
MMTIPHTPLTPAQRQGQWAFANSLAILVLRLMLGWVFVYAGSQKLFGAFGSPVTMEGFAKGLSDMPLAPPLVWAYMAAVSEFGCGLLIMLGLLTRLAAIPLIITMLVAIGKVSGPNGFGGYFDERGLHMGYEFNLTLIAMAVALILTGAGLISLDALLFRRSMYAHGPQPLDQPDRRTP